MRWKLVGNAVTVGVAAWLGGRLAGPGSALAVQETELTGKDKWPAAAWGMNGQRWRVQVSMWPQRNPYRHLLDVVDRERLTPLSHKAAAGFYSRTQRSSLRFDEAFLLAMKKHVEVARPAA